ncbi:MAG: holin [Firmicutes bacterium]|nr:holin [Bacillota bacterium]MCL5993233.1 holin [Bacillota bacterium]
MNEVLLFASVMVPIVSALVEVAKRSLSLDTRYAPLLSLVLGVAIGALAYPFTDFGLVERLWAGALAGLGAMGLFDLGKKMKEL